MKISFFPVAEQYAYVAETIQKKKGISQNGWLNFVIYYCVLNVFLVPAILVYFGQSFLAGIAFMVTVAVLLIYKNFGESNAYVDFYRQALGSDPEKMEVELSDEVIRTACDDCSSVYKWSSFIETEETKDAIYYLMKDCGIAVPKTAFSSPEQMSNFLDFPRSKMPHGR